MLNFKTIEQLRNKLRATKIAQDLSFGRMSYIAITTKVLLVLIATLSFIMTGELGIIFQLFKSYPSHLMQIYP